MSEILDIIANQYIFPILVLTVTFGLGLTLTVSNFLAVFSQPKALVLGSLGQFLLLPAVAIVMGLTLPLGPVVALGLCLICFCPGGALSNAIVFAIRGNAALSVSMTVVASIVMMMTLPFILPPVVKLVTGNAVEGISTLSVLKSLVIAIAVPLALGMAARRFVPRLADIGVVIIRPLSVFLLLAAVFLTVFAARDFLAAEAVPIFGAAALLSFASVYSGYFISRGVGEDVSNSLTISIEVGIQNLPFIVFLASSILGRPDLAIVIVAYGVMNLLVLGTLILLTNGARRRCLESESVPMAAE